MSDDGTLEKRGGYERWARKPELIEVDAGSPFLLSIPRRRKKTGQAAGRRDAASTDNRAEKTRITGKPPNCTAGKMPIGAAGVKSADDGVKRKRAPYGSAGGGKMKAPAAARVSKPKQKGALKGAAGKTVKGHGRKNGGR
ncbi:hypothetical protein TWF696_003723 [Orbilia brochopaga]|uniref:Uncharacterized protein n=1 Tax=Orbilia brochopaga TaxID=3140254 RepID=A0AAV9V3Y4_9PEZI